MTKDGDRWRTLMNEVMNLRVLESRSYLVSQLVSLVSFAVFWDIELRRLVDIDYKLLHPRTQKSSYLSP